jgi:hypothetical protein
MQLKPNNVSCAQSVDELRTHVQRWTNSCSFQKIQGWHACATWAGCCVVNCAGSRKGSAPGLVMERAVQEMSQLRQEIAQFMAQYERGALHTPQATPSALRWAC